MSTRDKVGVGVLVLMFALFCLILFWTFKPAPGTGAPRSPAESSIVQQRVINLQKGS